MRKWKITIQKKSMDRPITKTYRGDMDCEDIKKFFGCDQPDVEWYKINETN